MQKPKIVLRSPRRVNGGARALVGPLLPGVGVSTSRFPLPPAKVQAYADSNGVPPFLLMAIG